MENEKHSKTPNIINLRTDFSDISLNLEKFGNWNVQNFTELLNKPKKSFMGDLKNKLSDSNLHIDLNLDKFSDIGSPVSFFSNNNNININNRSNTEHRNSIKSNPLETKQNETYTSTTQSSNINPFKSSSPQKPFKILLQEDYTNYLKILKKNYPDFKFNHYSKYSEKVKNSSQYCNTYSYNSNTNHNNFLSNTNNTLNNTLNTINTETSDFTPPTYKPSHKIFQLQLTKDFLLSESEFKIEKSILEKKREDLETLVLDNIEKGGMIEMEVEKILTHSSLLYNYIENNLSLESQVDYFLDRIKKHKEGKEKFKRYVVMNTNKLLMKGSKKNNLEKMNILLKGVGDLKNIIDKIYSLDTGLNLSLKKSVSSKNLSIQEENELLNRGKEIVKKLKFEVKKYDLNLNQGNSLNIVDELENELLNRGNKSSEKSIEEFVKLFMNMFKNYILFDIIANEENKVVEWESMDLEKEKINEKDMMKRIQIIDYVSIFI